MLGDLINYSSEGSKLRAIGKKLMAEGKKPTLENVKPLADEFGILHKTLKAIFPEIDEKEVKQHRIKIVDARRMPAIVH